MSECDVCGHRRPHHHGTKQGWRWCYKHDPPLTLCPSCAPDHLRAHESEEKAVRT